MKKNSLNLGDLWLGKEFYLIQKTQSTEGKVDKLEFINIKNFGSTKYPEDECKPQAERKNIRAIYSTKDCI